MDTSRLRTVGIQTTSIYAATHDATTQTTCFDAVNSYAENLADWVIKEAFRYGRDLEKFASCLVDCILMDVFMTKSLRNLALYVDECKEADRPYPVLNDSENIQEEYIKLTTPKGKNVYDESDSCILCTSATTQKGFSSPETQNFSYSDITPNRSELNSSLSNPDSLQMLEDDIIRCLQTLTDDEEELLSAHPNSDCFSDNSFPQFSSQVSELDSGFLSSEDGVSVDHRNAKRPSPPRLPSLTEELEECFKFKWPQSPVHSKSINGIHFAEASPISPSESPVFEQEDPVAERQKVLRNLLVRELKVSVEHRRRKVDEEIKDSDLPSRPMFKAQATKSVWMPGSPISTRTQEEQLQSTESTAITRLENLDSTEDENENSAKYQKMFFGNPSSEDFVIDSRGLNNPAKPSTFEERREEQIADSSTVPYQNFDKIGTTDIGANGIAVGNNEIHTDTYYAIPIREVTTTSRVIKAPAYDGIGPTEEGIPIGLRSAVPKEHSGDWYKTMFRSLHRQNKPEENNLLSDGYMSDPEFVRKEKPSNPSSFLDCKNQSKAISNGSNTVATSNFVKNSLNSPFPAAKSSYKLYSHKPWIISDYEPGYSSIADTEAPYENKRHLPPIISPKPKYVYNDGYESDSTLIRKTGKIHSFDPQEQKQWYQEVQKGGDIPIHGLGKPAPERMKEPVVGPPPPFPANLDADHYYNIYSITETDPNRNGVPMVILDQSVNNNNREKKSKFPNDFCSRLDEVLQNQHEDNLRQSPRKFTTENNQVNSKNSATSTSPVYPSKVTVLYDFEAQTSRELSLKNGDVVNVKRKIDKNWLEGEHHGVIGIFPASYVETSTTKPSSKSLAKTIEGSARAKFDFVAQNSVELSLCKDDVITLTRQIDSNWYEGMLNGKTGIFPVCYVEMIKSKNTVAFPQTLTPSPIRNPAMNIKEETNVYSNESPIEKISPEGVEAENLENLISERGNKTKAVIHNHEGNKVTPYKSIYAYRPQNDDELELKEGDIIYVVEKCDDGWFVGTSMRSGLFGTFPGNYVERI